MNGDEGGVGVEGARRKVGAGNRKGGRNRTVVGIKIK